MFLKLFMDIFIRVYTLYIKIENWLYQPPFQLFTYIDNELYARGYIGYEKKLVKLDHFKTDGEYSIIVNNDPIRSIKNVGIDGFNTCYTYFITKRLAFFKGETKIEIVDHISEKKKTFDFSNNVSVDYLDLITVMDQD